MMFKITSFAVVLTALHSGSVFAFAPSNRPYHAAARKSSLSMSAALIVQNKGGGHGEIGKENESKDQIFTLCYYFSY